MKKGSTGIIKSVRLFTLTIISFVVFYSCIDKEEFNLDKLAGVEWAGEYALPILNSSLTIKDILPEDDSSHIKEDGEGLMYFEYNEKVLNYDIRDYFQIPSRSINRDYSLPKIKLPSLSNTVSVSLQQMTGTSLNVTPFPVMVPVTPVPNEFSFPAFNDVVYVRFSQGTLSLTVTNNAKAPLSFNVSLNNSDNTWIGNFEFINVAGNGGTQTKTHDLSEVTLKKQIKLVITSVSSTGSTGAFNSTDKIEFSTSLSADAEASEGEIILQEDVKIAASEQVDFELAPEQLYEILLKNGAFNYSVNSQIDYNSDVKLSLPSIQKNGIPFTQELVINPNGNRQASNLSLENYTADLTTLSPAYNRFPIQVDVICKKSATSTFKWKSTDEINVQISMEDLTFKHLKGFFGTKVFPLEENTFSIDAFENSLNGTNISFHEPSISFNVYNDYGVPLTLDFKRFTAFKDNQSKNILTNPASPFLMASPQNFGDGAAKTLVSVVNSGEIYDLNPSSITYQLDAILNKNVSSGNNFLTDTSKVIVEMNAKIPLWGRAGNIQLEDTIDNSLEGDIDEVEISYVKIKAFIENQFPIDANVQIYFADDNYKIIDSLFKPDQTALITSSTVSADGELIKAGLYDKQLEVDKDKFERLIEAPYLIIRGNLSTANKGQTDVKIKSSYKLDVKLGLKTKLDIKANL